MSSFRASPGIDPEMFRHACAQFASGVTVATVRAVDGSPHGLTVSSFTSVSMEPPLILICVGHNSGVLSHLRTAGFFAVNILSASQREYSVRFSEKPEGRFDEIEWFTRTTGAPLLSGSLAFLECRKVDARDAGDHAILVGEVLAAETDTGNPLIYFNRAYRSLL